MFKRPEWNNVCSEWNTLLLSSFVLLLELLWVRPFEHGWIKFAIVILLSGLVRFQNAGQLAIEYIEVHLLQTITVSKVDFIEKPLIPLKLVIFEGIEELPEIER